MKKTVLLPIEVPDNDYCWDGHNPCNYFSNEGGHPVCDLSLSWDLKYDKTGLECKGVKKPEECLKLVESFPLFKKLQKFQMEKEDE